MLDVDQSTVSGLSIHDLTRRSTDTLDHHTPKNNLSIHDLTRRSTSVTFTLLIASVFQFTTSQGGRH